MCYMNTYSFIVYRKTDDIFEYIVEDVKTRFDISNCKLDRPLSSGKNNTVIRLMKDELGGKIMTNSVGLRAKTYSYLINDGSEDKNQKTPKNVA